MTNGDRRDGASGFTLVEALVVVALSGLLIASLATLAGQWLPQWRMGFARTQGMELLEVGLRRIVADLDAAEFVTADNRSPQTIFEGDSRSLTLTRVAAAPGVAPRLEIVRIAPNRDDRGAGLFRDHTPFTPLDSGQPISSQVRFSDPVALIRAPLTVTFSYAGPDRVWRDHWSGSVTPPAAIRVRARDATTGATLAASTATHPWVDAPAACVGEKTVRDCLAKLEAPPTNAAPSLGDLGAQRHGG